MNKGKGLIRATSRRGTASKKRAVPERATGRLAEPSVCERCGAVYSRRVWRRRRVATAGLLDRAVWTQCPACKQSRGGEYCGRVVIRGAFAAANQEPIRQRIQNVAKHAEFTQPERRLVSAEFQDGVLEVLTTSQKLAHRIAHELKKVFRGRASYKWSDDGSLFAVWERN
jgi:NMD protein affecting ribosome stability and mRNA decay